MPSFACKSKAVTSFNDRPVTLCFDKKDDRYWSENCKDTEKCFFKRKIELAYYPNQSPGFSLCYQIGGEPFFATIKGVKGTVPLCHLNSYFVDHETLMITHKNMK